MPGFACAHSCCADLMSRSSHTFDLMTRLKNDPIGSPHRRFSTMIRTLAREMGNRLTLSILTIWVGIAPTAFGQEQP